jgi:hypothetical protein
VSTKTITVTTTNDTNDGSAPPNPSQFQGVGRATDIQLSWENPTVSDFSHVRIMRQSGTVPVDPYDGTIVYEGNLEQFLDQHAQSGTMYGYTIFAADEHGNFSSGVTVFVRSGEEATRPEYVFESSAESTTTIDFSQKITVTQGEYSAGAKGNTITITNDAPFTLSLPTETLPRVLKTILVTLRHPRNTTEFTFLLRANRKRTAYESTIDTLTEVGTYPATVTVLDVSSKVLMKDEFMLTVEKGSPAIVSKEMSPWVSLTARIALLLTLMLLVVYTIRRLWLIGRRRREKM